MAKYRLRGIATVSIDLGVIEAANAEEAIELAQDAVEQSIPICLQCSHKLGDDPTISRVEAVPAGDLEPVTFTGEVVNGS